MDKTVRWHTLEIENAINEIGAAPESGLTTNQAKIRLAQFGANELIERRGKTAAQILWEQVTIMVVILIGAAILAGLLGDTKSAISILVMTAIYALLGFFQEYRAEKTIAALKKISVPNTHVLRDGALKEISARELVPGDIIQLETGNIIPADLRLLQSVNLRIQEAALTGSTSAIEKHTAALSGEELPLGDRRNMTYMGSIVIQGRGQALVVATGMNTELGKIADLIQQVKQEETPLHRRLDQLGKSLAIIGAVITAIIFALGFLRGDEIHHMLLTAVNIAVAIVPEGLPAVVTITLALGAQRMLSRQALIRKLPAVETLGSVSVICSDKTGTLTENRMTVVVLDVAEHALDLTEEIGRGGTLRATRGLGAPAQSSLSLAAIGGALCNDAKLIDTGDDNYHTLGDPTEGALVAAAAKMGYWKSALDHSFPRTAELPFDTERKRMTTVHHLGQYNPEMLAGLEIGDHRYIAFTKGSVEGLFDITTHIWADGKSQPMNDEWRAKMVSANERLSKKGMRVLGIGFRLMNVIPEIIQTDLEQNLTLVGLFGMIDPPRVEVKDAVATCRAAGIRPVMITSDHPSTAIEIARQLGITESGLALTGNELEKLSFDELKNVVEEVSVFARVSPEDKLRIVQALQEKGHVVSMTGDGVNDAPALRKADIGIAMGITGTDVSKEASDMVLLDDNFAAIVNAVKEGRTVSDNIRKFVRFSAAGNIGKVLVMLLAPFLRTSLPLLPLQVLWLNFLTDGLLGLGMGVETLEADVMKRAPYSTTDKIFSRKDGIQTIWVGVLIGALTLGLGSWYSFNGHAEWQTMIFTSLAFMQVFQALSSRSEKDSFFKTGLLSNPLLAGMILLVFILQMMVMYIAALAHFFDVQPLHWRDLSIAIGAGLVVFAAMEWAKKLKK